MKCMKGLMNLKVNKFNFEKGLANIFTGLICLLFIAKAFIRYVTFTLPLFTAVTPTYEYNTRKRSTLTK